MVKRTSPNSLVFYVFSDGAALTGYPWMQGVGASTIPGAGKAGTRPKSYGDNFSVARKGFPVWPHPDAE